MSKFVAGYVTKMGLLKLWITFSEHNLKENVENMMW